MKYALLSVLALAFSFFIYAQDVDAILQQGEKAEKDLKEAEALAKYREALEIQPLNVKALWKTAELTGRIGARLKDEKQRLAPLGEARKFADSAVAADHASADANCVVAASAARLAAITSGKEKARNLRDMKNYADTALQLSPNHARALYILGKWNYEIYTLGIAEKAAVKVLFGGMPKASIEEAIKNFEKARTADHLLIVGYWDLANAYVKNHQTDKAIDVLNRMIKLPPKTEDDQRYKTDGRALLTSLQ